MNHNQTIKRQRILRVAREEWFIMYKESSVRLTDYFSSKTMEPEVISYIHQSKESSADYINKRQKCTLRQKLLWKTKTYNAKRVNPLIYNNYKTLWPWKQRPKIHEAKTDWTESRNRHCSKNRWRLEHLTSIMDKK